jgi:F420-dependent oxidoreductase-like protein
MRVGLQIPNFTWPNGPSNLGDTFAHVARMAERAGFSSFWVMDHFFQIRGVGPSENAMLEGWSALAFAAGVTNRLKLGTLVTGVTYRHPGILVKTATTLDVLSHGRSYFGIGAAWNEEEHRGLGVPFPPLKERFERLEETLKIALQMWSDNQTPIHGTYYQLERPMAHPLPVQRPHPSILIGGGGEQKTLRLVAEYGDACNIFAGLGDATIQHKFDILRDYCRQIGRDYNSIEKTTLGTIHVTRDGTGRTLTPAAAIDYFAHLAGLGVDQAIVNMPNSADSEVYDLFANEIIPNVAKIVPAGRDAEMALATTPGQKAA